MKILFESKSGKQVLKQFKTISEAKSFVIKNKGFFQNIWKYIYEVNQ